MYRRSYYRGRSGKYSNETVCFNFAMTNPLNPGTSFPADPNPDPASGDIPFGTLVVPATTLMGNRKVKNFTLKMNAKGNESPIVGVMVYLPEGTTPSQLSTQLTSQSLYEPNQNVIMSFVIPPSCDRDEDGYVTVSFTPPAINQSNRLARNLSSGDSIVLLFSNIYKINAGDGNSADPNNPGNYNSPLLISGTVNFAIKY